MRTKSKTMTANVNLREALKALVSTNHAEVTFVKKDGTDRTMICTTKSSSIPEDKQPVSESTLKENTDILRVYDLENDGWRSFRVESVKSFTIATK
jgi:S-adenosylhomocysteine hydrolase